jgi:methoxymalonate biosynthesis acyl carrier protein
VSIADTLATFLERRTKLPLTEDRDIFATGAVNSLFAMELVAFVEQTFGVTVSGDDLTLDNFRTIRAMTVLVHRLRS